MPLTYPIATSARTALAASTHARSKAQAERSAGGGVTLVSDWLRPSAVEYDKISDRIEAGLGEGFVQVYAGKNGAPVIAVTYWKRLKARKVAGKSAKPAAETGADDHTDDLYFSKTRKKSSPSRRRRAPVDPRQMDLFVGPDRMAHETPDPLNPKVMLVEEEGTGGSIRSGGSGPRSAKSRQAAPKSGKRSSAHGKDSTKPAK